MAWPVLQGNPAQQYFVGDIKFGQDQLRAEFKAQRGRWVYERGLVGHGLGRGE
jgi:hypothetical protein